MSPLALVLGIIVVMVAVCVLHVTAMRETVIDAVLAVSLTGVAIALGVCAVMLLVAS